MERLTEKVNGEYIHKVHKFCLNDCYKKLGKLEDIEEELGIPLEVLFKAMKDGVYIKEITKYVRVDVILKFNEEKGCIFIGKVYNLLFGQRINHTELQEVRLVAEGFLGIHICNTCCNYANL